jgi:hypothetical protein
MGGSTVTAVITLIACPAMSVPCSDKYGRPLGLQFVGGPRVEAALLSGGPLFAQLLVSTDFCRSTRNGRGSTDAQGGGARRTVLKHCAALRPRDAGCKGSAAEVGHG